jgi:hypothetical protein
MRGKLGRKLVKMRKFNMATRASVSINKKVAILPVDLIVFILGENVAKYKDGLSG